MGKINTGKVVVGGLAAGVVMNVCDFLLQGMVLRDRWTAAIARLGLSGMDGTDAIVGYVVVDFVCGLAIVWMYAAIRPRFGAGPKTSILAGGYTWLVCTATMASLIGSGVFHKGIIVYSGAASIVSALAGALVGGMLYKED